MTTGRNLPIPPTADLSCDHPDIDEDFRSYVDLYDPNLETAITLLSGATAYASIDSTASMVLYWDDHTLWAEGEHTFEFIFDRYIGGAGG